MMLMLNDGSSKMPKLGIGTFEGFESNKSLSTSKAVLKALEAGYRLIDSAFCYNNEREVGLGIRSGMDKYGIERKELFVTSKLWNEYHKPEDVEPACRQSLTNLNLDYLDLFLMHWPFAFERRHKDAICKVNHSEKFEYDVSTHFTETWRAMEVLVEKGLVKAIGVSNFSEDQLRVLLNNCKIKPAVNQIECHPYLNQQKLIDFCKNNSIHVTAYSPLGCKDRIWRSPTEDIPLLEHPVLANLSLKHGKSPAQVILKWQLERDVAVVPRMRTPSHINENFQMSDWSLSTEDMNKIMGLNKNQRLYLPLIEGRPWCSDHPHYPFKAKMCSS